MSVSRFSRLALAAAAITTLAACATASAPAPVPGEGAIKSPKDPAFSRADILGKTADDLDQTLGAPALVRREGDGEFRRYVLADCGLIVILYPGDKGAMLSAHIDAAAKSSEDPKPEIDDCLAAGLPQAAVSS